uniref:Uncharacterized protein n=1 Tax=Borely moumouvirus TaxID=2712067 RepID=A0A6G6ACF3_9VIRU
MTIPKFSVYTIFLLYSIFIFRSCQADIPIQRFSTNPLINSTDLPLYCDNDYNINFPTVVKTPSWLRNRLNDVIGVKPTYLMYFSDHHGKQIFMAWSFDLEGPWNVYAPGTLKITQVLAAFNASLNDTKAEVASADIYLDDDAKMVRMYFHRRVPNDNYAIVTSVAYSEDGIHFNYIDTRAIGTAYMRHFVHDGYIYLTDRQAQLWRSRDGVNNLEAGPTIIGDAFVNQSAVNGDGYTGLVRHIGLIKRGNTLYIYGTRVGDAPERVLWTTMNLRGNWCQWEAESPVEEGFRPVTDYEGANLPNIPSRKGSANEPVNQLRDPFPFYDMGKCFIFYTVAGESGIAGARLTRCFDN